jgi:hypothetical protein
MYGGYLTAGIDPCSDPPQQAKMGTQSTCEVLAGRGSRGIV